MKLNPQPFLLLFLLQLSISSFAQQKQGNIVEYFGKEKVEEIHEGELYHVFKQGLALKIPSFSFNSSSFPKDPVFSKFLMDPSRRVKEGEVFDIDISGKEQIWTSVQVDKTNSFNDPNLRSSYVYLSYDSKDEKTVLFEASGHSLALINGLPHEGDHYDFGYNLIPIKLIKGTNVFVLKVGRFPRVRARLIAVDTPIQFTRRDLTLPDLLQEDHQSYWGAIRVINATNQWVKNYSVEALVKDEKIVTDLPSIPPMTVRKIPFSIPEASKDLKAGKHELSMNLKNSNKESISVQTLEIEVKSKHEHHKKTFVSHIDGSVQYYSVAPSSDAESESQALFLSVHGASVEAVNQARAYKKKDWGVLIAPTNRRPFGFAWEDWGRLDALEVLADARKIFQPDPRKIYLTGHSMGGHGTWYLGATYPDQFAAIAPCAGYPDLLLYRDSFLKRTLKMPEERLTRFGLTPEIIERLKMPVTETPAEKIMKRAGKPSRTLNLIKNYSHFGVYVLHGEIDNVVPTFIARDMRERLGKFHSDFTYYEYPDGTHWYGDHSVDWPPIFDFFKQRTIRDPNDIKRLEFYTGSPGVSSKSNFISIHQQQIPFENSSFAFSKEDGFTINTENVRLLEVDLTPLKDTINELSVNGQKFNTPVKKRLYFEEIDGKWKETSAPSLTEKGPHRNGGFKDAFRNKVVFVYASQGSASENQWYYNKARFDAETFWYRANGSIEIIRDNDFKPADYPDQNVVLYGNKDNNSAWKKLLGQSPIQVGTDLVQFGDRSLRGGQWGLYFVVPRSDSDTASIGVVSATGRTGMKAAYANHYLVNGTTFPDVLIFDDRILQNGSSELKCAGFFGNDWSIETGDFKWK